MPQASRHPLVTRAANSRDERSPPKPTLPSAGSRGRHPRRRSLGTGGRAAPSDRGRRNGNRVPSGATAPAMAIAAKPWQIERGALARRLRTQRTSPSHHDDLPGCGIDERPAHRTVMVALPRRQSGVSRRDETASSRRCELRATAIQHSGSRGREQADDHAAPRPAAVGIVASPRARNQRSAAGCLR
jgi:hypothetical protein